MAEPETRTFRIELEVPNPNETLRDGVTAEIRLGVETVAAYFVSPAVLTLDDDGVVGVRLVDEADRVGVSSRRDRRRRRGRGVAFEPARIPSA